MKIYYVTIFAAVLFMSAAGYSYTIEEFETPVFDECILNPPDGVSLTCTGDEDDVHTYVLAHSYGIYEDPQYNLTSIDGHIHESGYRFTTYSYYFSDSHHTLEAVKDPVCPEDDSDYDIDYELPLMTGEIDLAGYCENWEPDNDGYVYCFGAVDLDMWAGGDSWPYYHDNPITRTESQGNPKAVSYYHDFDSGLKLIAQSGTVQFGDEIGESIYTEARSKIEAYAEYAESMVTAYGDGTLSLTVTYNP